MGSEKQIKWGEQIRKNFFSITYKLLEKTKSKEYRSWLKKRYDRDSNYNARENV